MSFISSSYDEYPGIEIPAASKDEQRLVQQLYDKVKGGERATMKNGDLIDIVQALPSLYPLTETEEKAILHMTTRQPVEFREEGCEDRAQIYPICPNCKEYLDQVQNNEDWNFCPYCGVPIEWE